MGGRETSVLGLRKSHSPMPAAASMISDTAISLVLRDLKTEALDWCKEAFIMMMN
jgi:hypothetical protein